MASRSARVEVIVPTAINVCLVVNENIIDNLRRKKSSDLTMASLYRRARMVIGETGEVAIGRHEVAE